VGDVFNYKIREITAGTVSTLAGTTQGESNGSTTTAQFDAPDWMAVDASDNIFICDAHYIREVSSGSVSTLYDGHTYSSQLESFISVALKPADTLILLDNNGAYVYQLTPSGIFTTLAGTGSSGYFDGPASKAQFSSATGVAVDANTNQRIRLITPGGIVSTIAGSGTTGSNNGVGTAAQFNYPHGVAVDKKSGNIYVLEPMSNRIRMITVE
jgi:DNA-binding beta-propeller fold protein YncE